jgi:DNA-directed RNA polymerase sigma subunit (sigma70/sigma32)
MSSFHPQEFEDSRGRMHQVYRPTPRILKRTGFSQASVDTYRRSRDEADATITRRLDERAGSTVSDDTELPESANTRYLSHTDSASMVSRQEGTHPKQSTMTHNESLSMLPGLNEHEHDVIRMRLGLDRGKERTHDEVGEMFNLTGERVKEIENEGLTKVRQFYVNNPDKAPKLSQPNTKLKPKTEN